MQFEGWASSCRAAYSPPAWQEKGNPGFRIIFVAGNVWVPLLRMECFSPNSRSVPASALGTEALHRVPVKAISKVLETGLTTFTPGRDAKLRREIVSSVCRRCLKWCRECAAFCSRQGCLQFNACPFSLNPVVSRWHNTRSKCAGTNRRRNHRTSPGSIRGRHFQCCHYGHE